MLPSRHPARSRGAGARSAAGGVRILVLASAVISLGATACGDNIPDHLREDIQERRLADAGVEGLDPSGESSSAGISLLRNLDVRPMNAQRIGADTTSAGFKRYVHRCGTCHATPDPGLKTASEWQYVFPRMKDHMEEAGLIPLNWNDRSLILEFLQRHAPVR